jgi:hypothetical protein
MRRIEPVFPDLLPLFHRLGPLPLAAEDGAVLLDPVEMRLVRQTEARPRLAADRNLPRRPLRVLLHAETACRERVFLERLIGAGSGILVLLDGALSPALLPVPTVDGQVVVLAPWVPAFWGGAPLVSLAAFDARKIMAGVLLALGPVPEPLAEVRHAVEEAKKVGAKFVLACPLAVPPEERHRVYDGCAGESGDEALENLLFHTDLAQLATELEREASRVCLHVGMPEALPGPATSFTPQSTFAASATLWLWARRLDLIDGVSSSGWQLRRAAQALLASGRDPRALVAEDNLRVIPGFTPWVEAFARSAWGGGGAPFDEALARWIAV